MAGSYVYLIRAGERIKVGHSANLDRRLRAFQTGNAEECHVVSAIWLRNAAEVERQLKDNLAQFRHREEWFNVSTRQAVEKLWGLRGMFVYDEQPETVVIERTYNAPVEKVWTALTDVDQVREWYFDQVREWYFDLKDSKPEVGFEFGFVVEHEGNRYDHRYKVTEVIPQRKIAYTWRYEGHEGDSLVTIELFPDGDKTRLKLTHEGLETFPKTPAFARENFEKGWTAIIGSELKEFVERKP